MINQVCATGIAPFGMVPVELVRYFHVSLINILIELIFDTDITAIWCIP